MGNLTIVVDDTVLKKARMRALEQGTSVNAVLRKHLEAYAGLPEAQGTALNNLLRLSQAAKSRRGQRQWTRDELHER